MIVWLMLEIINDNALMSDSIFILYIVLGLTNYHPSMRRDGRWLKTRSRKSPVTAICSLLLIGQRHSVVLLASYWLWCHGAIPWQKIGIPDRHRCRRHKWTSNWNSFAKNSVNTQHTVLEWYAQSHEQIWSLPEACQTSLLIMTENYRTSPWTTLVLVNFALDYPKVPGRCVRGKKNCICWPVLRADMQTAK